MKEMSLQQAVEFWKYLQDQTELKRQAFLTTRSDSSYKNEMRAEAQTYQGLAEKFSGNFEKSITGAQDITHGLTAEQVAGFLDYLDGQTIEFKAALEKTRHQKQEALATEHAEEYSRVSSIYKDMENLEKCQIMVFENSRKSFLGILQEE